MGDRGPGRKSIQGAAADGFRAIDKVVAQISKSAVSQVSKPAGRQQLPAARRLEIGDTAGFEACATFR
jgi:hypothetical protein